MTLALLQTFWRAAGPCPLTAAACLSGFCAFHGAFAISPAELSTLLR